MRVGRWVTDYFDPDTRPVRLILVGAPESDHVTADAPPACSSCAVHEGTLPRICLSGVVEQGSQPSEGQDPGPQAWCVCGEKVTIAAAREVTLPNGRPGWEGYCPECGGPLFAARRKPASG